MEELYTTDEIAKVYDSILKCVEEITELIRFNLVKITDTKNHFGEEQLNIDKETDEIIYRNLKESGVVYSACSEESIHPTILNEEGKYIVTFDPLDGSSILDAKWAVGSIFAIWPKIDLIGASCREIVGAALAIYGNKACAVIYSSEKDQVDELTYWKIDGVTSWVITDDKIKLKEDAKHFAPGNLRITKDLPNYKNVIDWYIINGKRLRYSGGMASDFYHMLHKKDGVFLYPGIKDNKKTLTLRVLYECAPLAFLTEKAGGIATDGEAPILDIIVDEYAMKTPIFMGSKNDIERVGRIMKGEEA